MRFGSIRSVDGERQRNGSRRGVLTSESFSVKKRRKESMNLAVLRASPRNTGRGEKGEGRREKQSQADTRATDRRIDRRRNGDSESCEIDNMLGDIPIILSSPPSEERTVGW